MLLLKIKCKCAEINLKKHRGSSKQLIARQSTRVRQTWNNCKFKNIKTLQCDGISQSRHSTKKLEWRSY